MRSSQHLRPRSVFDFKASHGRIWGNAKLREKLHSMAHEAFQKSPPASSLLRTPAPT